MLSRDKSTLFWTIVFPILLILIFGAIFGREDTTFDLYLQDLDDSELSGKFIEGLNSTKALNVHAVSPEDDPDKVMKDGQLSTFLIIPKGFEEQLLARLHGQDSANSTLVVKMDPSKSSAQTILGMVDGVTRAFVSHLTGAKTIITISTESVYTETFRYIDFFVPGVIGMVIMTTSVFGTIEVNTKYRNNGVLKKLATTPLSRAEWIVAKALNRLVITFISAALVLAVGYVVFSVEFILNFESLFLIVVGSLAFSGMGMIIARFVKEQDAADAAGNAIIFPMMFLSGTFFPLEMMPDYLQPIARVLPLTYLNNGLRDAMIAGDQASALFNTLVILVVALVTFVVGSIVTNWTQE